MAYAMPLNSSARACVPADLLQLISVDYRALKDSPTAMALKQQLMPDNIKQFEAALKNIGLDPDKDVDTLTFASFRAGKQGVKTVGVAAGPFNMKAVLKKMKLQKSRRRSTATSDIYPMDGGFVMSFLDDSTLLFGDSTSIRVALDTRDGQILGLDTNGNMADMMTSVDSAPVWSILDQQGTQNVMHSAHGRRLQDRRLRHHQEASAGLALCDELQQRRELRPDGRHLGLHDGRHALLPGQGRMLYKKMSATPAEKVAVENTSVDSDGPNLQVHFKANDQQFQSLMHSELFAAVSH